MTRKPRREALFTVEAYCGWPKCPARTTTIEVKDYENTFADSVARQGLACPVCWRPLTINKIVTATQRAASERKPS